MLVARQRMVRTDRTQARSRISEPFKSCWTFVTSCVTPVRPFDQTQPECVLWCFTRYESSSVLHVLLNMLTPSGAVCLARFLDVDGMHFLFLSSYPVLCLSVAVFMSVPLVVWIEGDDKRSFNALEVSKAWFSRPSLYKLCLWPERSTLNFYLEVAALIIWSVGFVVFFLL